MLGLKDLSKASSTESQLSPLRFEFERLRGLIQSQADATSHPWVEKALNGYDKLLVEMLTDGRPQLQFTQSKALALKSKLLQRPLTYPDFLDLSAQIVALFELHLRSNERLYSPPEQSFNQFYQHVQRVRTDELLRDLERGVIYLPVAEELSFADLNLFWFSGIRPLGVVNRPTLADRSWKLPVEFWNHDRAHAIGLYDRFTFLKSNSTFFRIRTLIQTETTSVQDVIERMIFFMSHEIRIEPSSAVDIVKIVMRQPQIGIEKKKFSKNDLKRAAEELFKIKTGFGNSLDFIRDPEQKITVEDWVSGLALLIEMSQ